MEQVEKSQGKVEARSIESIDAGLFGEVPYLQTQWVYRVNDGKAQRLGGLKQISMEKATRASTARTGSRLRKTFNAVVKAFAETFESTTAVPTPYYEVAIALLGMKVGIAVTTLVRDDDGDMKPRRPPPC